MLAAEVFPRYRQDGARRSPHYPARNRIEPPSHPASRRHTQHNEIRLQLCCDIEDARCHRAAGKTGVDLSTKVCASERELLKLHSCCTRPLQRADMKQRQLPAAAPQQLHRAFDGNVRSWRDIHGAKDVTEGVVLDARTFCRAHNKRRARGTGDYAFRD